MTSLRCESSLSQWLLVGGVAATIGLYCGVIYSESGAIVAAQLQVLSIAACARPNMRTTRRWVGSEAAASSSNGWRACNSSGVKPSTQLPYLEKPNKTFSIISGTKYSRLRSQTPENGRWWRR
ncbi:hypothetical protein PC116_g16916 [Phytophthora cactorum]|nr:hypothetical protein PC116_g16916 [Phytophthora cactorum]